MQENQLNSLVDRLSVALSNECEHSWLDSTMHEALMERLILQLSTEPESRMDPTTYPVIAQDILKRMEKRDQTLKSKEENESETNASITKAGWSKTLERFASHELDKERRLARQRITAEVHEVMSY